MLVNCNPYFTQSESQTLLVVLRIHHIKNVVASLRVKSFLIQRPLDIWSSRCYIPSKYQEPFSQWRSVTFQGAWILRDNAVRSFEDQCLLWCNPVLLGEYFPVFWRFVAPSFSWSRSLRRWRWGRWRWRQYDPSKCRKLPAHWHRIVSKKTLVFR
jgi:hypothetical protein